jgi:hypothetical protein
MHDLELEDIKDLLTDHGYSRSIKSIKLKIEEKKVLDKKAKQEKTKENANKDIVNYRAKILLQSAKTRARYKDLDFELELDWIKQKLQLGKCEATGLNFVFTRYGEFKETKKLNPYAPSLDRIDSSLGYTVDNTQIVIIAFNKFKSDTAQHKVINIAKAIVKHHMCKRQFTVHT